MNDEPKRDMTLSEWVGRLTTIHPAYQEYIGLRDECERLKAESADLLEALEQSGVAREAAEQDIRKLQDSLDATTERCKALEATLHDIASVLYGEAEWEPADLYTRVVGLLNDYDTACQRDRIKTNEVNLLTGEVRALEAERDIAVRDAGENAHAASAQARRAREVEAERDELRHRLAVLTEEAQTAHGLHLAAVGEQDTFKAAWEAASDVAKRSVSEMGEWRKRGKANEAKWAMLWRYCERHGDDSVIDQMRALDAGAGKEHS